MGRLLALAVVAAASLLQNLPALPKLPVLLSVLGAQSLLFLLVASLFWYGRQRFKFSHISGLRWAARILSLSLIFVLTLVWATWRAELRMDDRLSVQHENVVSRIVFRVTGMVQDQGDSLRFQARVLSDQPTGIPRDIQVVWRKPSRQPVNQIGAEQSVDQVSAVMSKEVLNEVTHEATPQAPSEVTPGQVWRAALIFRRPRGALNPHGFDYEGHVLGRNIRAIGRVRGVPKLLGDEPFDSMEVVVARTRQNLRGLMRKHVKDMSFGAVLIALAIGDQDSVKAEHWEIFNKTGITHLVSISGSHVTMLAAFGGVATFWGWKRMRWRGRAAGEWIPAKVMAGLVALLVAWLYCLLAGWGVPARRTFFMLLVTGLALFSRLPVGASSVLCLAAAVVTLIDPWSPMSTGFWLSFGAVAVLFFVGAQAQSAQTESVGLARRWWLMIKESARLQWIITLAMLPVLAFLFQQVSMSSPLANAVAIPVVTFVVTPLALVTALVAMVPGLDGLATLTAWLAHAALDWTMIPVTWLAHTPWSAITVAAMPGWCLLLSLVGIGWALQPPGVPVRWVGWTLLLPALTWLPDRPLPGAWELIALDVGQGGAILIRTHRHALLFDAGPRMGSSDAGQRVIVPVMRAFGLRRLDAVMVSHSDIDHAGGLPSILKDMPVFQTYASFNLSAWLGHATRVSSQQSQITYPSAISTCEAGQQWTWDGVIFKVLHPLQTQISANEKQDAAFSAGVKKKRRTNADSCVLHIQGQYHSALLPGDIGVKEEASLIGRSQEMLRAEVVVIAHHGSLTSSSSQFVQQVRAQHAIAQAGYLNRFAHPAPAVEKRWREALVRVWRTDMHGAVTAQSHATGLDVYSQSERRKRYWHERE